MQVTSKAYFDFARIISGEGAQKIPGAERHVKTLTDVRAIQKLEKEIAVAEMCKALTKAEIHKANLTTLAQIVVDIRTKCKVIAPLRVLFHMVSLFVQQLFNQGMYTELSMSLRVWEMPGEP